MTRDRRSLPQAAESAMALVCAVPPSGRDERRAGVHDVVARATSSQELEDGIAFEFANTDDIARMLLDLVLAERDCCARFTYSLLFEADHAPIELRLGTRTLVQPLKDLYAGIGHGDDHG